MTTEEKKKMSLEISDFIVDMGTSRTLSGNYYTNFDTIRDCFGVDLAEDEELLEMITDALWDREEVIEVAFDMETPAFDMLYGLNYCGLYDEDSIREELCPEQQTGMGSQYGV